MAIRVGRWDCFHCGNIGNLGPHLHCSQCGGPRRKDVRFYLPTDAQVVEDETTLKEAKEGTDWVCVFCANNNRSSYDACVSCGGLKSDSEAKLEEKEYTLDKVPTSSEESDNYEPQPMGSSSNPVLKYGGYTLLAILAYILLGLISSDIEVTVEAIEWNRSIEVEEYRQVEEDGWAVPSGGQIIKQERAVHHYDRRVVGYQTRTRTVQEPVGSEPYVCGQRDLGNGYFEDVVCHRTIYSPRQESYEEPVYQEFPVYKTRFWYNIYRWKPYKNYDTKGTDKLPEWENLPDFIKSQTNEYRVSAEKEAYYFKIIDHKNEGHWYKSDYTFWDEYITIRGTLKATKSTVFGHFKGLVEQELVQEIER